MRYFCLFEIVFCILLCCHSEASQVRVRLLRDQKAIELTAENLQMNVDDHHCRNPKVKIGSSLAHLVVKKIEDGWELYDLQNNQICEISSRKLKVRATKISLNRRAAAGEIIFDSSLAQSFDVIANLDLEDYLVGVLSKEMPASFPLEAFKAQAIASRSYAIKKIQTSKRKSFDLENSVADQVFEFSTGNEKIKQAVAETKSMILENQGGKLFSVYFHADCGGHTEEASDVWGTVEKIGTVADESCPLEPRSQWNFAISKLELTARLRVILQLGESRIIRIDEFENSSSGRKKTLKFILDDHTTRFISGQQLRYILGYEKLKSTLFSFNQSGSDFVFEGRGSGHGVGMCQWGARHMALGGAHYPRILKHYYPQAKLAEVSRLEL